MESTASYWKPLVNIFEITKLDYTVINARDYKNLPGKKTDVLDSEWIADLLQHGMLRDSFIPSREQRELREATRYRKKLEDVVRAMNGIITPFQKTMMKEVMKHIDELTERIQEMDDLIDGYMKEYEKSKKKLEKMPGLGKRSAEIILAEIGRDMSRYPTAGHICSWAGVCPGNNESAGKRRSGKTRKGNKILKSTLVECAQSAVQRKNTFFYAQYQRIAMRRGKSNFSSGTFNINSNILHDKRR